jgi:hypothetical protein
MAKDERKDPPNPKYDIAVSWGLSYPNGVGGKKPPPRNSGRQ